MEENQIGVGTENTNEEGAPEAPATEESLIFGKYNSLEEAEKGYYEIQQKYKPMDAYDNDSIRKTIEEYKNEKAFGENSDKVNFDPEAVPEFAMLFKGIEKAGLSKDQTKSILQGIYESESENFNKASESRQERLGTAGMAKIEQFKNAISKFSEDDKTVLSSLIDNPYNNIEIVKALSSLAGLSNTGLAASKVNSAPAVSNSQAIAKIESRLSEMDRQQGVSTMVTAEFNKERDDLLKKLMKLTK